MTPTLCRDEAMRIGGALALAMLHRPGWGWVLSYNGKVFRAVLSTPDFHHAGSNGRAFDGKGDTPGAALDAAMAASASYAAKGPRSRPAAPAGAPDTAACPG